MDLNSATFYVSSANATSKINGNQLFFSSFNIRECLGDLYNQYDKFKLVLNCVMSYNTVVLTSSARLVSVRVGGLDFIGTYDYSTKTTTDATIALIMTASSSGTSTQLASNYGAVFNKPSGLSVNLTINFYDLLTNSIVSATDYGVSQYCFTIYGVN